LIEEEDEDGDNEREIVEDSMDFERVVEEEDEDYEDSLAEEEDENDFGLDKSFINIIKKKLQKTITNLSSEMKSDY